MSNKNEAATSVKTEEHTFDIEVHESEMPVACLVLGHGAGAGREHRADKLMTHFTALIEAYSKDNKALHNLPVFIGGKSMGGRMATMVYESVSNVKGAIALGYPFHPPGKPEKTRTEHLQSASKPLLIIQGERDTFGTKSEVESYKKSNALSSHIKCEYLEDGDHSFKPRKASGKTQQEHIVKAAALTASFIDSVLRN